MKNKVFNIVELINDELKICIGATNTEEQAIAVVKRLNYYAMNNPKLYGGATFSYKAIQRENAHPKIYNSGVYFAHSYDNQLKNAADPTRKIIITVVEQE